MGSKIRSLLPAEQQPHIIAMTANAMLEDQEACSAPGMESYLSKPVRVQELRSMLARVRAPLDTGSSTLSALDRAAAGQQAPEVSRLARGRA